MNKSQIPVRVPNYLKKFSCIGPACEDNCCIGWDVEFDKKTYKNYLKVDDSELKPIIQTSVYLNPTSYNSEIDYAKVVLPKDKICPFLNEKRLCRIQAKLGEAALSNVCYTYPRFTSEINGVQEYSATVSCPEAARLILSDPKGIRFESEIIYTVNRHILNYTVNTRDKTQNLMIVYLLELRSFTIDVLQNRALHLWERLLVLGHFFADLQKLADQKKKDQVPALIRAYNHKIKAGELKKKLDAAPTDAVLQQEMLRELAERLHVFTEIDSKRFIDFAEELKKGLRPVNPTYDQPGLQSGRNSIPKSMMPKNATNDPTADRVFYQKFEKDHAYILENYLVNYVYESLFPAGESTRPFEAYLMLAVRFALVNYYLAGIAANRKGLTKEAAISFIQSFAKTVEHHKTYLEGVGTYLNKRKFNNLSAMSILIKPTTAN